MEEESLCLRIENIVLKAELGPIRLRKQFEADLKAQATALEAELKEAVNALRAVVHAGETDLYDVEKRAFVPRPEAK